MDDYAGMSDEPAATDDQLLPRPHRHWYRLALVFTIVLVIVVVASLPLAVSSMQEVLGRGPEPLFDLVTGDMISPETAAAAEQEATYVNLGMVDLDDSTGLLTLAVSGNRLCGDACPALDLTFLALDDDADQRRGLPPSAILSLTPDDVVFSQTVQLPLRGQPSLYPFDTYQVWLGVGGVATLPDGTTMELRPENLGGRAVVTLQNRIPDMIMDAPTPIHPDAATAAADPFGFLAVQAITFERPAYLKVLAVVLVALIAVSATMALFTREVNDLALGIGGLILGVWGIRSILMPQGVSTVTAIDLALSWLILLLLLGLALRAALHFHRHSDLPMPRPRRSR
jgi:hypothetical protein